MSEQPDARPAAFLAAWGLLREAGEIMQEAKFGADRAAELSISMAAVYARLATATKDVGTQAGHHIDEAEKAAQRTDDFIAEQDDAR
ncbi:hypothetical protein [Mycobacterium sp. SMC-13]|uniref:hypothetical protein n=1 Tax=Mycobacterium sp. SMC-13 TaxID=3381626 RepID=UPI0038761F97